MDFFVLIYFIKKIELALFFIKKKKAQDSFLLRLIKTKTRV